ncbi:hypothetical protein SeMB42_g00026 [Synchytrium endobioticum]|uniref:AB hydrolase-1 domain-containing protein n=1 Tax=Synchytrium endobioticum TaxID=286115 RepID=A0A507DUW5_9FUNG|nr:hypothetical protein SeMB42_g00026 [Synchytrium endobioticum]
MPSTPDPKGIIHVETQPENPFISLVNNQNIAILPDLTLENGTELHQVPIAYKTWGKLNASADNAMVICHALSGSADVEDWWGPLIGPGRAFDPDIFFIFCGNMLGSPYGSASPVTNNPNTGKHYGPSFPPTSIRDDVSNTGLSGGQEHPVRCWRIHGWNGCIRVGHSAWGISWGEAQRQAIYSDPKYCEGWYSSDKPPNNGLAAARMSALLTYRSRHSFESRFGRKVMLPKPLSEELGQRAESLSQYEAAAVYHNEGNKIRLHYPNGKSRSSDASPPTNGKSLGGMDTAQTIKGEPVSTKISDNKSPAVYSAQSYLRYQGDKFVKRFDANCYIAITRKMDTHDVAREKDLCYEDVLGSITQPALIIGVETDGLFTTSEQYELAEYMPNSKIVIIDSFEGHDGFLLEFDQMNRHVGSFFRARVPNLYVERHEIVLTADEMKKPRNKKQQGQMRATLVVQGASKRVLTSKDGNKNFYKGTGSGAMGHFVQGGRYVIDEWKRRQFVVPEGLSLFKLTPYVSPEAKTAAATETWTDTHSVMAYLTHTAIPPSVLERVPDGRRDLFVQRCRELATTELQYMRRPVWNADKMVKKWYYGPKGKRLPQWWHEWNPDKNEGTNSTDAMLDDEPHESRVE